jgi:large subunit ribosomal protein L31
MKKNIHPKYQEVLFVDSSTGQKMVIGSTLQTEEREVYNGKEYPLCRVSVSSSSHPFFTGSKQLVDAEGRIDKFIKRYSAPAKQTSKEEPKEQKEQKKKQPKEDSKAKKKK